MEFLKKYKTLLVILLCAAVAVGACLYVMWDSEKDDDDGTLGGGDLIAEYDISLNGDGSIKATLYKDGLLDIKGSGKMKALKTIPWLDYVRTIDEVKISEGITNIGDYAFYHCTALLSIEIPSGVTSIGEHAFDGSGLNSVVLPDTLTEIGQFAFDGCPILALTVPASVTDMGYRAFQNCTYLETLTLKNGLTQIGEWAFYGCVKLKSVTVPASVTFIGNNAFYGCEKLDSVTFENTADWYITKDRSANSGTSVTVLTSAENALNLVSGKADYYWKRNV